MAAARRALLRPIGEEISVARYPPAPARWPDASPTSLVIPACLSCRPSVRLPQFLCRLLFPGRLEFATSAAASADSADERIPRH